MAKVRVVSNPLRTGRVGADTFYITKGQQIVRPSRNVSNYGETARRSEAQQQRRVKWANLVSIYKNSKLFMSRAFETKKPNQTDYNKFMSINMPYSQVSLTKEEAEQGACVIEPITISMGSLQALNLYINDRLLRTGLLCTTIDMEHETVNALTSELLEYNPWLKEGMQISFIKWEQVVEGAIPRVYMSAYELTLDTLDDRILKDVLPSGLLTNSGDQMAFSVGVSGNGGATALLSYSADGKGIRTSTQKILLYGSGDLYNEYSSSQASARARESYGEDTEHFLDSGDMPKE